MNKDNTKATGAKGATAASDNANNSKLPWEKPEFTSVQPLSETHAIGGVGVDGGANHS